LRRSDARGTRAACAGRAARGRHRYRRARRTGTAGGGRQCGRCCALHCGFLRGPRPS